MKNRKTKNIIVKCAADMFIPLGIVFGFYIVFHGDTRPGGGFQGGVLVAAAVALLFLGYGKDAMKKALNRDVLRKSEALAEIAYVGLALVGVAAGVMFCRNIFVDLPGFGTEIASLMNDAVGFNVLTGIGCLLLVMLGTLSEDDEEGGEEA